MISNQHKTLSRQGLVKKMNEYGSGMKPFYFITDFSVENNIFIPEENVANSGIEFSFGGSGIQKPSRYQLKKNPVPKSRYSEAFNLVMDEIRRGNSFLVNLTQPTPVETELSLRQIFELSDARYKLLMEGRFVVFSPETFVSIAGNTITSFPMKGTIPASLENAEERLLSNEKETAEHATIVDLIRNDLSMHASSVRVDRFKFLQRINAGTEEIIQMSSQISGQLKPNFLQNLGNVVVDMLPAGSVSGAPKRETLKIIENAENYQRGYYSGVAGYFDGASLDSFVMIRYIELSDGMIYKSGGGITHMSDMDEEYDEMISKVYVPVH